MEGGVSAHDGVASLPVDGSLNGSHGIEHSGIGDHVDYLSASPVSVGDRHFTSVPAEHSCVARLASPADIERGPVQHHPLLHHLQDGSFRGGEIRVACGQLLGGKSHDDQGYPCRAAAD